MQKKETAFPIEKQTQRVDFEPRECVVAAMPEDKYLMSSLDNALHLLDVLAANDRVTLAELQKLTSFSKASLFKMLYTLEKNGYVEKSQSARYRLSTKFAQYGNMVLDRIDLLTIAREHLRVLSEDLNETVHLSMLTSDLLNVVFLAKMESRAQLMHMNSRVGLQIPSYVTSSGKAMLALHPESKVRQAYGEFAYQQYTPKTLTSCDALLAELDRLRERGYALDDEESEEGLVCIGAAIHNISGGVAGAISVSGPKSHMHTQAHAYSQKVMQMARNISQKLGYGRYPSDDNE